MKTIDSTFETSNGYLYKVVPIHPNADHQGRVLVHRLVMERKDRPIAYTDILSMKKIHIGIREEEIAEHVPEKHRKRDITN